MSIKPLVLMDLDDTIFQTPRKMDMAHAAIPASYDKNGNPASWLTRKQAAFFEWLSENSLLIPVTGRSAEQLANVRLPFASWKIASHGALLLDPSGCINQSWLAHIEKIAKPLSLAMEKLVAFCNEFYMTQKIEASARIIYENGNGIYIVMKHKEPAKLKELYSARLPLARHPEMASFYITANGNNLSILPKGIDKGAAARELLNLIPREDAPVLGFGDGLADLSFLKICDWWGTPAHSQIDQYLSSAC